MGWKPVERCALYCFCLTGFHRLPLRYDRCRFGARIVFIFNIMPLRVHRNGRETFLRQFTLTWKARRHFLIKLVRFIAGAVTQGISVYIVETISWGMRGRARDVGRRHRDCKRSRQNRGPCGPRCTCLARHARTLREDITNCFQVVLLRFRRRRPGSASA